VAGARDDEGVSVNEAVERLRNRYGVQPEKILLGVPFYGKLFFAETLNDPLPKEGRKAMGMGYAEAMAAVERGEYLQKWDPQAQAAYLEKREGPGVVSYESPRSLGLKCRYVVDHKLSGIIIWVLGSDLMGNRTPLLDTVAKSFHGRVRSIPPPALDKMEKGTLAAIKKNQAELYDLSKRLLDAGKKEEAKAAEPDLMPAMGGPRSGDSKARIQRLEALQLYLTNSIRKIRAAQRQLGIKKSH
jgi:hypothetical protein